MRRRSKNNDAYGSAPPSSRCGHIRLVRAYRTNTQADKESELLLPNDTGTFLNHDQLIGGDFRNRFGGSVWPPYAQIADGLCTQAKMQATIIRRIKTRLGMHFLRLAAVSIDDRHASPDRTLIALHASE